MKYQGNVNQYIEEEKKQYDALLAKTKLREAHEVDNFINMENWLERVGFRYDLFLKITALLPPDVCTQALRKGLGEEYIQKYANNVAADDYQFKRVEYAYIKDKFSEIFDAFRPLVSSEQLEEIFKEMDNYVAPKDRDDVEYPMNQRVNELKQSVLDSNYSTEEKEQLSELLDKANDIIRQDSNDSTSARSHYSLGISQAIYHETKNIVFEAAKNNQTGGILSEKYGSIDTLSVLGNVEKFEYAKSQKIHLSEIDKAHYLRILEKMQEHDLLRPDTPICGEEGTKVYAFHNIAVARSAVEAALESGNMTELAIASKEYEKHTNAMREIYRVAAEELGEDLYSFPDNLDNQRNPEIPFEFKKHYKINAAVNSLYLSLQLAREMNIDVKELLEDPTKYAIEFMKINAQERTMENFAKGKSLGQMLAAFSNLEAAKYFEKAPYHLAGRVLEGFDVMSSNTPQKKENIVAELVASSVLNGYNEEYARNYYFLQDRLQSSSVNMFLMGEEGMRNPAVMSTDGYYDLETFAHIPGTQPLDYLATHPQDPAKLKSYIEATFIDFIRESKKAPTGLQLKALVEGAREAARDAILFCGLDMKNPEVAALARFHDDPKAELIAAGVDENVISWVKVSPVRSLKEEMKAIAKTAKARASSDKKVLKAEEKYNKKADKLQKRIDAAEAKLANAKDDKAKEKLTRARDGLKQKFNTLKENEIKRLEGDRAAGKITDVYYQRRTGDVKNDLYANKRDLYADAKRIEKKEFIAEQIKNGISKQEATLQYSKIEAQKMTEVRATAARQKLGLPEKKVELVKNEKVEKTEPAKAAEPKREATVKQLDLSDKIRKPVVKEIVLKEQTKTQEISIQKEAEDQMTK